MPNFSNTGGPQRLSLQVGALDELVERVEQAKAFSSEHHQGHQVADHALELRTCHVRLAVNHESEATMDPPELRGGRPPPASPCIEGEAQEVHRVVVDHRAHPLVPELVLHLVHGVVGQVLGAAQGCKVVYVQDLARVVLVDTGAGPLVDEPGIIRAHRPHLKNVGGLDKKHRPAPTHRHNADSKERPSAHDQAAVQFANEALGQHVVADGLESEIGSERLGEGILVEADLHVPGGQVEWLPRRRLQAGEALARCQLRVARLLEVAVGPAGVEDEPLLGVLPLHEEHP